MTRRQVVTPGDATTHAERLWRDPSASSGMRDFWHELERRCIVLDTHARYAAQRQARGLCR